MATRSRRVNMKRLAGLRLIPRSLGLGIGVFLALSVTGSSPAVAGEGIRAYFDLLVEAGGRAVGSAGGLFLAGGGLGLQWGGDPAKSPFGEGLGYWSIVGRARGGGDPAGAVLSMVDLR